MAKRDPGSPVAVRSPAVLRYSPRPGLTVGHGGGRGISGDAAHRQRGILSPTTNIAAAVSLYGSRDNVSELPDEALRHGGTDGVKNLRLSLDWQAERAPVDAGRGQFDKDDTELDVTGLLQSQSSGTALEGSYFSKR